MMIDISSALSIDGWAVAIYCLAALVAVGGLAVCVWLFFVCDEFGEAIALSFLALLIANFAAFAIVIGGIHVDSARSGEKISEEIRSLADHKVRGLDVINTQAGQLVIERLRGPGYFSGLPAEIVVDNESYIVDLMISVRGENGSESSVSLVVGYSGAIDLTAENVRQLGTKSK